MRGEKDPRLGFSELPLDVAILVSDTACPLSWPYEPIANEDWYVSSGLENRESEIKLVLILL